jgi:hypothetical protein
MRKPTNVTRDEFEAFLSYLGCTELNKGTHYKWDCNCDRPITISAHGKDKDNVISIVEIKSNLLTLGLQIKDFRHWLNKGSI